MNTFVFNHMLKSFLAVLLFRALAALLKLEEYVLFSLVTFHQGDSILFISLWVIVSHEHPPQHDKKNRMDLGHRISSARWIGPSEQGNLTISGGNWF